MTLALQVVLPLLAESADRLGLRWLLVGATARDLLIAPHLPAARLRASLDIDLAVQVEDWSQFERLRQQLLATGRFGEEPGKPHRLVHGKTSTELDLLPYGGVADAEGYLQWPGCEDRMRVSFYPAIAQAALAREVAGMCVYIPSGAGLVAAKLASWRDASSRSKDIEDTWFIMGHYLDLTDEERLYSGNEADLLDADLFDYRLAAVRMLGRDIGAMDAEVVAATLLGWLAESAWREQLALALQRVDHTLNLAFAEELVLALEHGLLDAS